MCAIWANGLYIDVQEAVQELLRCLGRAYPNITQIVSSLEAKHTDTWKKNFDGKTISIFFFSSLFEAIPPFKISFSFFQLLVFSPIIFFF